MATIKQYAVNLWDTQVAVARKLGADLRWSQSDVRILALSMNVCIAGVIKALTNAGTITDAQLVAIFTQIQNAPFPVQPDTVTAPGEDGTVTEPDLGP